MNDASKLNQSQEKEVIWEERNYTEPEKNYLNSNVPEQNDITTKTNKEYPLSEWPITIKPIKSGIYKIINKINNKYYVGSAKNIRNRWKKHFTDLNTNRHPNYHLQSAYNKYGKDSFIFTFIEEVESNKKLLYKVEYKYLRIAKKEKPNVYNLRFKPAGGPTDTYGRWKISEYNKTRVFTKETRAKMSAALKRRKVTNETRQKLSDTNKLYYSIPENRQKLIEMSKKVNRQKIGIKNRDKTIYKFINVNTGEIFEGIRYDFRTKYNLRKSSVNGVIKKRRKTVSGWRLFDNSYVPIVGKNNKYKNKEESNFSKRKIKNRPSKEELLTMIWNKSTIQISNEFCVSKGAIRKWCIGYNIPLPPVGYWIKLKYGYKDECLKIKEEQFKKFNLVCNFDL